MDTDEIDLAKPREKRVSKIEALKTASKELRKAAMLKAGWAAAEIGLSIKPLLWSSTRIEGAPDDLTIRLFLGTIGALVAIKGISDAYQAYSQTGEANSMDTAAYLAELLQVADNETPPQHE